MILGGMNVSQQTILSMAVAQLWLLNNITISR